jgi:hypothetical protein
MSAVGRAVQPCIQAHHTPKSSVYTATLRLERQPSGTADAKFLADRPLAHAEFEACAVDAIRRANIPLPDATTVPVAFDFGPEH